MRSVRAQNRVRIVEIVEYTFEHADQLTLRSDVTGSIAGNTLGPRPVYVLLIEVDVSIANDPKCRLHVLDVTK